MTKYTSENMHEYTLMESDEYQRCMMCINMTKFIDYICEGRLCSEECSKEFYNMVKQQERGV